MRLGTLIEFYFKLIICITIPEEPFLTHLSYYYVCEKNYPLALENAYQVLTIAREAQNKPSLALGFATIAYTYWSMGKFIKALFFIARSLIIQPPWHGANGQIIWQKFVELLKNKFRGRLKRVTGSVVA